MIGLLFYFTDGFDFIMNFVFVFVVVGVEVVNGGLDVVAVVGFIPQRMFITDIYIIIINIYINKLNILVYHIINYFNSS